MMVLCRLSGVSALGGGSSIYCDTLSVSQYDSKVRSDFSSLLRMNHKLIRREQDENH